MSWFYPQVGCARGAKVPEEGIGGTLGWHSCAWYSPYLAALAAAACAAAVGGNGGPQFLTVSAGLFKAALRVPTFPRHSETHSTSPNLPSP